MTTHDGGRSLFRNDPPRTRFVDTSPEGRRRHHMETAITTARAHGFVLVRRTGGFWTWPGCPVEEVFGVPTPTWNVGDKVINDLLADGRAVVEEKLTTGGPCKVRIKG